MTDFDAIARPALPPTNPPANPPAGYKLFQFYDSLQEVEDDLRAFAKNAGFATLRLRSANNVDGKPTYITLCCDRGNSRASIAKSRKTSTAKLGCPWRATLSSLKKNDRKWLFKLAEGASHNHDRSSSNEDHLSYRGFHAEAREFVAAFANDYATQNREIGRQLRQQYPEIDFMGRDIDNLRARLRKELLGGLTATQATLKALDDLKLNYHVDWKDPATKTTPRGLFWTYPWCEQMWKRFPEVQSYDNTYKTNRFGLFLFMVTGMTNTGSVFNAGFGLIDNEREDGFQWVADRVDKVRQKIGAAVPSVILTDFDKAMKKALRKTYPTAYQQICVFHLNKNIVLNIKRKWIKMAAGAGMQFPPPPEEEDGAGVLLDENDEYVVSSLNNMAKSGATLGTLPAVVQHSMAGLYLLWAHMVYSRTEEGFNAAWAKINAQFHDQQPILAYIRTTYIPIVAQWAGYCICRIMNFGQRTTSPTECCNRKVKSYLVNANCSIYALFEAIGLMIDDTERVFKAQVREQKRRAKFDHLERTWLSPAARAVSWKALDLVVKQYRSLLGDLTGQSPLQHCIGSFNTQFGIPCAHQLQQKHGEDDSQAADQWHLEKHDFHRFWWLDVPLVRLFCLSSFLCRSNQKQDVEDPYLRIYDPDVVTVTRGRPAAGRPFAGEPAPQLQRPPPPVGRTSRGGGGLIRPGIRRHASQWEGITLDGDDDGGFIDDDIDDSFMNDVYDDFMTVAVVPSTIPAPEPPAPTPLLPTQLPAAFNAALNAALAVRPRGRPAGRRLAATDTRSGSGSNRSPARDLSRPTSTGPRKSLAGVPKPTRSGRVPKLTSKIQEALAAVGGRPIEDPVDLTGCTYLPV